MVNQTDRKYIAERTAQILIDIEALGARPEEPFTSYFEAQRARCTSTAAGLSRLYPKGREVIGFLQQLVEDSVDSPIDAIAGGETAGIPYAAFLKLEDGATHALCEKKAPKVSARTLW